MCTWASTAGVAVSASSFLGRRGIWLYSELLEVASTLAYLSDRLCKVDCHNHSGTDFFRPAGRSQVIQQSGHMPEPTSQVMQPSSGGSSLNLCQLKYVFTLCVPSRQNSPLSRASDCLFYISTSSSSVSLILHSLTYIPVGTPFLFLAGCSLASCRYCYCYRHSWGRSCSACLCLLT